MIPDYYIRNFLIYYNNLSTYYVICVLMSLVAIVLSWIFHFKNVPISDENVQNATQSTNNKEWNFQSDEVGFENLLSTFKKSQKQHTIDKLAASLTEEQLNEEKQAERQQLAAILELLKQQEDKFQVGTMEELEGQLKLYR